MQGDDGKGGAVEGPAAPERSAARPMAGLGAGLASGLGAGAPGEAGEGGEDAMIDPRLDRLIGQNLKAHYDDILAAPLPDKFIVLLAQLAAKEGSS